MSNTPALAGPSLAPLLVMFSGAKPLISPALSTVRVPPGWASLLGAVVDEFTTLPMPLLGALLTCTLVGVARLVVVLVPPLLVDALAVVVVAPAIDVVVSPGAVTAVVVVPSSATAAVVVVVSTALAFLLPPPQAAATSAVEIVSAATQ